MRWTRILAVVATMSMVAMFGFMPAAAADHTNSAVTLGLTQTGDADGTGTINLTFNETTGEVCYTLTTMNIDPATAAHIHVGAAGAAGPVLINLDFATNGAGGCVIVPVSDVMAVVAAPGDHYVNVHNAAFPNGAIRAQVAATTPSASQTSMTPFMPTGDPAASGSFTLTLDPDTGEICFTLVATTTETVQEAHIHTGSAGMNGGVLVNLDFPTNGLMGCVMTTPANVATILADPSGHYVNVHTDVSPLGAMRGQISATTATTSDSMFTMDGVGFGDPDGSGTALFTFYPGGDVCFMLTAMNIGDVTASHIHIGAEGVLGGVVVNLAIPENGLTGCVTSTDAIIDAIIADPAGFYVNFHTAEFPDGAVRGQLAEVVPAPATTMVSVPLLPTGDPDGSGMADFNIDPATGRVCFDLTANDVDTITAAHIHVGAAGTDGGVVVNLDTPTNGLMGCVFTTPAIAMAITNDLAGHYVNLHNAEHPTGAIRAQLDGSTVPPATSTMVSVPLLPSGDPNGSGTADFDIDPTTGEICFDLTVADVDTIMAAHIHVGAAGMDGGVVVDLDTPTNGLMGCVMTTPAIAQTILDDLGGHYVNLHTAEHPTGAVRAQLDGSVVTPTATAIPTAVPTAAPTAMPTAVPTAAPTVIATAVPTAIPTAVPTAVPTAIPTAAPVVISSAADAGFTNGVPTHAGPVLATTGSDSPTVLFGAALVAIGAGLLLTAAVWRRASRLG